jgi:DUF4097 and DUF4098 domain-containing protein YvlB
MPTFDTREPIIVTFEIGVGDIRLAAGDRTDTVVEVRPTDPTKKADVTAAQQTRVEYAAGRLLIKAPKGWKLASFRGGGESVTVDIQLPAGSHVRGEAAMATVHATGRLGECRIKTAAHNIHLEQTGPLQIKTAAGDITVGHVAGDAEVTAASGTVRIDRIDGAATIKNANGDTVIGTVTGDLKVRGASGKIVVEWAGAGVMAKTANGDVRLQEVTGGPVVAHTAYGKVDIGVRDGVPAWLDLDTSFGTVHSDLNATERPAEDETAVEVQARSAFGDITIRRATSPRVAG